MSWAALFGFLTSALEFCGKLLPGKSSGVTDAAEGLVDAPAARAGTAAGAAANTASHMAGQAGAKK